MIALRRPEQISDFRIDKLLRTLDTIAQADRHSIWCYISPANQNDLVVLGGALQQL
jgi:hypothetical protein